MSKELGSYCSVAKINTVIQPKAIPGYTAPEGKTLISPNQQIKFVYDPIQYAISYELNGGSFNTTDTPKYFHTVEDSYTPPTPYKEDCLFDGWVPESLELNTVGDVTFEAYWTDIPRLVDGVTLKEAIKTYMEENVTVAQTKTIIEDQTVVDPTTGEETIVPTKKTVTEYVNGEITDIMAIQMGSSLPSEIEYVNVSKTNSPIYMWFNNGVLFFYAGNLTINCNSDMAYAFMGMTILRDISGLQNWICPKNAKIDYIFANCSMLSNLDPIANWAGGEFSSFYGAFDETAAVKAGRAPTWYRWKAYLYYKSTTGVVLDTYESYYIPGQEVYAKKIAGYSIKTKTILISEPDKAYDFLYDPLVYSITYETYGGELTDPKTEYTIEDEDYTPQSPVREGYTFTGWSPSKIAKGSTGNVHFIASYTGKTNL